MLMGLVIAQIVTYWRFVKTDKKHIVALVVSMGFLPPRLLVDLTEPEKALTTLASTVASGMSVLRCQPSLGPR
jgi:hypothetical protein